jgi:hypothetical protein
MRAIIDYIKSFFSAANKVSLLLVTALASVLIFLNYHYFIDYHISGHKSFLYRFSARYIIYLIAFALPYSFYYFVERKKYFGNPLFGVLVLIAPAIFSLKAALNTSWNFNNDIAWNIYWNDVFYWPVNLLISVVILYMIWKYTGPQKTFYGFTTRNMNWKPYLLMLLFMIPLIAAASTQNDFLDMYPKLKMIAHLYDDPRFAWWHKLVFEISYGSDFINIELFFRGFLILAFIKWAGKDAILPMACFYCTIHFGKPLGECISSYFGGMILGIVVYNTRSILGGLIVHLGIAWMMELGGYIGNSIK